MADTIDQIRKLLALALNNPNEEEARSAAMQAARLIEKHNVTMGGQAVTIPTREWQPPDTSVEDLLRAASKANGKEAPPAGHPNSVMITDNEMDDDFMRKRITLAWRAIQETRKKLEMDIYHFEQRTGKRWER